MDRLQRMLGQGGAGAGGAAGDAPQQDTSEQVGEWWELAQGGEGARESWGWRAERGDARSLPPASGERRFRRRARPLRASRAPCRPHTPPLPRSQIYISSLALLKMLKHGRAGVPRARGVPSQQPCTAPVGRVRTHVGAVPPPPAPPACTHPRLCALALQPAPPHHTHTHLHPPAHSWLDDRESRNWDLVVVYWGERDNFTCADCVGVLRQQGPKWRLVHALVSGNNSAWEAVAQRPRPHEAVMVADDDVSGAGAGAVGGGGGRPSSAGHAWEGGEGGAGRAAQSV